MKLNPEDVEPYMQMTMDHLKEKMAAAEHNAATLNYAPLKHLKLIAEAVLFAHLWARLAATETGERRKKAEYISQSLESIGHILRRRWTLTTVDGTDHPETA